MKKCLRKKSQGQVRVQMHSSLYVFMLPNVMIPKVLGSGDKRELVVVVLMALF